MMRSPLFNELLSLRDTVDHIFRENPWGDTFGTVWSRQQPRSGKTAFPMPLDIYSNDDEIVILAAVPGMDPEDLDLTIQKNTLMISGELNLQMGGPGFNFFQTRGGLSGFSVDGPPRSGRQPASGLPPDAARRR